MCLQFLGRFRTDQSADLIISHSPRDAEGTKILLGRSLAALIEIESSTDLPNFADCIPIPRGMKVL